MGGRAKTYGYSYDANGNKATLTTPEGRQYNYSYNKNNQVTGITFDNKTITLEYQWQRQTTGSNARIALIRLYFAFALHIQLQIRSQQVHNLRPVWKAQFGRLIQRLFPG